MNDPFIIFLFSLTILPPAILGLLKYRQSDPAFHPFLWYIFISALNEIFVGMYLVQLSRELQIVNWHLFNLIECLLLLTQFYYWGRFRKHKRTYLILMIFVIAFWIGENLVYSRIYVYNAFFLVIYSFIFVLLSINTINYVVVNHHQSLFKNSMFVISVGIVIMFIYTMIVSAFLTAGFNKEYLQNIFSIKVYVNALVNIIYASGIYFLPHKNENKDYFN